MPSVEQTLQRLQNFFTEKIQQHGPVPQGVDWNSAQAQTTRFDQLVKIIRNPAEPFSLIDYGCGYGALVAYLLEHNYQFTYVGYDMTPAVIADAQKLFHDVPNVQFTTHKADLTPADYVICAGVFSMKLDTPVTEWEAYVKETLREVWAYAQKGLSFNMLTKYSDADKMRPDLYYPDPSLYFDLCKTEFSRNVALLHDYELYDFTMLVRK